MGISEKWESRKYGNIWEYAHGMQGMWECIELWENGNVLKYLIFRPIPGRPWVIIITPKSG